MEKKEIIIREVRILEFYSKHIWPIHRRFARKYLTPRCRRCILPESYAPLVDGLCPHCRGEQAGDVPAAPVRDRKTMQHEFDTILRKVSMDKSRNFHVLMLFSGGKDSSYMLHRLLHTYPELRILALTVDNTFMSPVAMENIQEIIRRLGVDHMVMRPNAATMEKMYRYGFLHLNEKGCSGTVDQFDGDFFSDLARNLAAEMNIPYIICGLSPAQVETILGLTNFITDPAEEAKAREAVAGIRLQDVFDEEEMKYWWNGTAWPAERRPRMIFPLYIWDLEEEYIKSEVLRLGLMPRGDESPLITNHRLIPLMGIVDMLKLGYSSFEPEFAGMIRQGKADRKLWLYMFEIFEYAARSGRFLGSAVDEALDRLSLKRSDVGLKSDRPAMPSDFQETIPDVLKWRAAATPSHIAFMEKDAGGRWRGTTWEAFQQQAISLARRLYAAGMRPGDQAALLMGNGLRWEVVQHAVFRLGGVVIGLDRNDPAERMAAIFSMCTPKYLFVDNLEGLKCIPITGLKAMRLIVSGHACGNGPVGCRITTFNDLPPASPTDALPQIDGDRIATMIFTSGTTGKPKALSFRHRQLRRAMSAITTLLSTLPQQAHTACWLPLANPFQRIVNLCGVAGNWKVFIVPDPTTIMAQVREIQPHLFAAVPRFYEKLYQAIQGRIDRMPLGLTRLTRWAQAMGRQYQAARKSGEKIPRALRWRHALAERLVLRRVRKVMGGNLQCMISGSAPAGPGMLADFAALGWEMMEAYGISENIIPMAINPPDDKRQGSVGRPLSGNTIRIAADREILVKGPGLAVETESRLSDGFLSTGDLGMMDEDGYLYLIGRKSDMFKLSTGRKIQPGPVEEAVGRIGGVLHCVAAGAGQKYVTALINMEEQVWHRLIRENGDPDRARTFMRAQVHRACGHLPAYSRPVDIAVVTDLFTPGTGELTANQKLRRNAVLEKYSAVIEALYRDDAANTRKIPLRYKKAPVASGQAEAAEKRAG